MQAGGGMRTGFGGRRAVLLAAAIAAGALPAAAQARATGPIVPHAPRARTVEAHAAPAPSSPSSPAAPPAASPTPPPSLPAAPSESAPTTSGNAHGPRPVAEAGLPGSSVPAGRYDPPYPEGLPAFEDDECDVDCLREWHDFLFPRYITVRASDELAAALLKESLDEVNDRIRAEGFVPGAAPDYEPGDAAAPGAGNAPGPGSQAAGANQGQGSAAGSAQPSQAASEPPLLPPDAISGASPIVSDLLGVWDGSWVAAPFAAVDALNAWWNGVQEPCPKGSHTRADAQVTDPNGGSGGCF